MNTQLSCKPTRKTCRHYTVRWSTGNTHSKITSNKLFFPTTGTLASWHVTLILVMVVFKQKSFNSSKTQELSKTSTQNYTNQSHNTCTRRAVYWELVYIRDFQSQHYTLHIHATATSYKYITHNYTAFSHLITFYISPPLSPLLLMY